MTLIPPAPKKKSVWARWWMILIYLLVAITVISCVAGALTGGDTGGTGDAEDETASASATEAADDGAEPQEDAEDVEGFFEAQTLTGSGDDVLDLPSGAEEGIVTASHAGSANFSIAVLTDGNESTGELLVNTIGDYEGTTVFGVVDLFAGGTKLDVAADGDWEITIAHTSAAPVLELPADGSGDAVFQYEGDAASWALTHEGDANVILSYYTGADFDMPLLVNEIGSYEGTVAVTDGPALVVLVADGAWTISAA